MPSVKAVMNPKVRRFLAKETGRREFLEVYLGLKTSDSIRIDSSTSPDERIAAHSAQSEKAKK
jgi:hypothetical protein